VTILHIKHERFADAVKRANVARELLSLEAARSNLVREFPAVAALEDELRAINEVFGRSRTRSANAKRTMISAQYSSNWRARNNDTRAGLKRKKHALQGADHRRKII
jgi:hypothetical protein